MCIRHEKSTPMLRWGLLCLVIANVLGYIGRRAHQDIDFFTGAMFGISIGLLLLSIWRNARPLGPRDC